MHLGKGTLTLNPFHSDRLLMSSVAIGGLLAVILSCLDCKNCEFPRCMSLMHSLLKSRVPA